MSTDTDLKVAILMSVPGAQFKALKATLTEEQLAIYRTTLTKLKEQFIEDNDITDPALLRLLDEKYK